MLALAVALPLVLSVHAVTDDPPIDMTKLHPPVPLAHDSAQGARLLEGVRQTLDERLSRADRRRLGRKVLSERRVRIFAGSFGKGTALVVVDVPLRVEDPSEPRCISGVFTLSADARFATAIVPLQMRPERFAVQGLGDVDGDGRDDIQLFSGSHMHGTSGLIRWNGDELGEHEPLGDTEQELPPP